MIVRCVSAVKPPPTCLEDLIPDGETGSVGLVVRHELDEELVSGGDNGRRGDLAAVLPHQLATLVHAISHLHIVIPEKIKRGGVSHIVL